MAKNSLASKTNLIKNNSRTTVIKGLGNSQFKTLGTIDLQIDMLGAMYTHSTFDIVPDHTTEFDIILGVTFFKKKG